MVTYYIDLLT
uniref:Uncharacterized protein n=1 Tax=Arundo donax TaxID=35708 RepID=A0A0A9E1Y9_ARUDO